MNGNRAPNELRLLAAVFGYEIKTVSTTKQQGLWVHVYPEDGRPGTTVFRLDYYDADTYTILKQVNDVIRTSN